MRKIIWVTVVWVVLLVSSGLASTMQSIGKDRVNVRSKPDLNSEVVFEASLGYPIHIEKQHNNWVYFTDWKDQHRLGLQTSDLPDSNRVDHRGGGQYQEGSQPEEAGSQAGSQR